jgi:hypothetical protein
MLVFTLNRTLLLICKQEIDVQLYILLIEEQTCYQSFLLKIYARLDQMLID